MLFLLAAQEDGRREGRSARRTSIGPSVNDEFGDVDAVLYTITGDGASYAQLKEVAEALRKRLQRVPDVSKVDLYGDQGERIFVEFSHAKLATLGVPLQAMLDSLAKQNALAPAGEFQTDAQRVPLRVSGAVAGRRRGRGDAGLRQRPDVPARRHRDRHARLRGPAVLSHPRARASRRSKSASSCRRAATFSRSARRSTRRSPSSRPTCRRASRSRASPISRRSSTPRCSNSRARSSRRWRSCSAVSFLSLGWRSGLVVATSVPLVLAIVFVAMAMLGLDLQRVTLGALIIALGLLVDDAIIAVEMIVVKLEQGWDRERAASFAWTSTAFPMLTGTLVTAAGFMPIGLANSTTGEYTGGIFWVVGIALVASWFVAVLFTPFLGFKLLPSFANAGHRRDENAIYATPFYRAFRRALEFCVARPLVVIVVAVAMLGFGLSQFSKVQQQFFPLSERPELFFELRLAEGSAIQATEKAAREAERLIAGDADASSYTTYIGKSSPRFWLGLQPVQPNESFAQIVIVAKDVEARERIKARIEAAVANGALSAARVRVDRFNFGPPVGFPVQFRVDRPRRRPGARDRGAGARRDARRRSARRRPASQLGREDALAAARRRSGARPRVRPDAAGHRADAADADRRRDGDDDPRRRRAHRRRRPRRFRASAPRSIASTI